MNPGVIYGWWDHNTVVFHSCSLSSVRQVDLTWQSPVECGRRLIQFLCWLLVLNLYFSQKVVQAMNCAAVNLSGRKCALNSPMLLALIKVCLFTSVICNQIIQDYYFMQLYDVMQHEIIQSHYGAVAVSEETDKLRSPMQLGAVQNWQGRMRA